MAEREPQRMSAMQRFTCYRLAVPAATHDEFQRNEPSIPQFEGVIFTDGSVAVRWRTACRSTSIWTSLEDLLRIHGHPEYDTCIVWEDGEAPAFAREFFAGDPPCGAAVTAVPLSDGAGNGAASTTEDSQASGMNKGDFK